MGLAFSAWWVVGWAIGFGGAVAAAVLLVVVIRLAGRIASQGDDIARAIDGARVNTTPLFDLARTNLALDQTTRHLARLRDAGAPRPPTGGESGP